MPSARHTLHALKSPLALFWLPRKTLGLFLLYLASCAAILAVAAWLVVTYEGSLRDGLLGYLFPDSWHFAASWVVDRFLQAQRRTVLINAVNTAALVLVTLSLFWLKELVSASFEQHGRLTEHPVAEHPLWEQGWEELKLLVLFLAVQMSIFWIGYPPDPLREALAIAVSYLFLFFTYAIDFLSPLLQRHRGHYSRILKLLLHHPAASLVFGAIFALPPICAGLMWEANPQWSTTTVVVVLFGANIVSIAWAAVSGTWLAAKLLPHFQAIPRSTLATRGLAWVVLLTLFGANSYAFGAVGLSIHHKSQILKLDYKLDTDSVSFERPGLADLLADEIQVAVQFDVIVYNPTKYNVVIERNRLELTHDKQLVATTQLPEAEVRAGAAAGLTVQFPLAVRPSMLRKGRDLLSLEKYKLTLYLQVADDFEFPVYLR